MNTAWQLPPQALLEDDLALTGAVERIYRGIYQQHFLNDLSFNHALPIETRAVRRIGHWRVFLVLTPWMLARLLVPGEVPALSFPPNWSVPEHEGAETVVLGPLLEFTLGKTPQRAHLNYHALLGHYLIQPLVLAMGSYRNAEEVYAAWNEVIRTRDENMKKTRRDCEWQHEISRREFFSGLFRKAE